MNLYYVWAKDLHYTEYINEEVGGPSYDDGWFSAYISAETPGKAKVYALKEARREFDHVEWTQFHVQSVQRDTEYLPGIVRELWDYVYYPKRTNVKTGDILEWADEDTAVVAVSVIPVGRGYLVTQDVYTSEEMAARQPKPPEFARNSP